MGDSRGESLTSRVVWVTFISRWQSLKRSAGSAQGQVIKTLKQMYPCVHPSMCAGALEQLPVEELPLAFKISANTPVLVQTAPLKQNMVEPKLRLEAIMK